MEAGLPRVHYIDSLLYYNEVSHRQYGTLYSFKKMRHKKRNINGSYQNDEENISLAELKRKHHNNDPNSYDSLCMPTPQTCDFCEKISCDQYSSFIHNAKHIIIPLYKLTVYQCKICLHHFTSTNDLIKHESKIHPSETNHNKKTNTPDRTLKTDQKNTEKQEISNISQQCLNTLKPEEIIVKKEIYETSAQIPRINSQQNSNSAAGPSLKSRLLFEEDIIPVDCDKLLSDLTTDCHVNVESFPQLWDIYPNSIHYEQLVKPGVYRCKKCKKMFPNRYEMIKHESQHIFIKNSQISLCSICNMCILGDNRQLEHHKLKSHALTSQKINLDCMELENDIIICEPNSQIIQKNSDFITKQNNTFITKQNGGIIHKQDGGINHKQDGGDVHKQNGDIKTHKSSVITLKMCDLCLSFCKKRRGIYDCVGELNEIGKRYKCHECGFKFFTIKLVKREITYKCRQPKQNKSSKVLSNETRLKLIKNRFKMMRH